MSLPSVSVRRPVAVAMLYLAVVLLGLISFFRLPIDLLPEVSYPRLVVYTAYPQVAPPEVERLVTRRIEAQAAAVPGVERITSVSREGVSLVTVRFAWGTNMDFAMLQLRERLDNLRDALPEMAHRPRILRVDPEAEPILTLSVAGGPDLWTTKEIAETVFRRRLEQLDGVAEAAVTGGLDREIRVEVDPERLELYGLTLEEISQALAQANVRAPGGTVLRGRYRYPLRTLGEFRTVEEIGDVVVGRRWDPSAGPGAGEGWVRLRDVARVVDAFAEREAVARYNGQEAVGILIFKEVGANTVTVARRVDAVLQELRREYPAYHLEVASSQAGFISDAISNVVQALVFGGMLAFLVLFLFLRDPRYPVAVALAIPISVVAAFGLMDAAGVSLNIMSLGGLALGVGMLVDNSIVVLENVFRHRRELGKPPLLAAAQGADEVRRAITASTLTTISVFGPIVYVRGVAGELFGSLSLAVAFSLVASLLVALTLLPTLAARLGGGEAGPGVGGPFARFLTWFDDRFQAFGRRYHRVLEWSLDHPGRVLVGSALALGGAVGLGSRLDRNLLPEVDQGAFQVRLELPEGTALAATLAEAEGIEAALLADPGVEAVFSRAGREVRSYGASEETAGSHTALFHVRLRPHTSTREVLERVRSLEGRFPEGAMAFETGQVTALGQILGGVDADLAVRVRGEDLERAFPYAETLAHRLAGLPGIGNVRLGSERGRPEIQVEILPEAAARHGIQPRAVAEALERAMRGTRATEFADFDRKIPVVVRLPDSLRFQRSTLWNLHVQGVPLRELVRVRETAAPSEIRREDQGRVVTVYADVLSGGLQGVLTRVEAALAELPPEADLRVEVGGENEEMRRSFRDLAFAFGLALLLVYMILAAQFESFLHPFTILAAVPLAVVGAVLALGVVGEGINTMSLIGGVILVGIVVNDAIVKVDFIVQGRGRGMPLREAILEAGRVRLRPIVMTTATTVLGLAPMALGVGPGADLRAPLALAVIGGLAMATVLTLVVVPVVFAQLEGLRERWRGGGGGKG